MLSFAGVLTLVLGSLMLFRVPGYTIRLAWSVFIPTVGVISAFFVTVATLAFRAQVSKPQTGVEGLLGMIGEVKQDLQPAGKIFVHGELWNAVSDQDLRVGEKVQVVAVENLRLKVEKIDDRE